MNYDLAKELKEAGFPGISFDGCTYYGTGAVMDVALCLCKHPTLEELIEACGDRELSLVKKLQEISRTYEWRAAVLHNDNCVGYGPTPTEAVARLWLALNKPNTTSEASS